MTPFSADHIRPTTDRVKESLFNIWRDSVDGAKVLDLFCGTGSLGLEALSRGATSALFVDESAKSLAILQENIKKLKISEPIEIQRSDAQRFLKNYKGQAFDLIFIDPPFTEQMADDVMGWISASTVFHATTRIAIESGRREKIADDYLNCVRYDVRTFGDKFLSFFRAKETEKNNKNE